MTDVYRILFLCLVFLCTSCSKDKEYVFVPDEGDIKRINTPAVPDSLVSAYLLRPSLKVLFIGNSYTDDYTSMLYEITSSTGETLPDVSIYKLTRGGGSFMSWYRCFDGRDGGRYVFAPVMDNLHLQLPSTTSLEFSSSLLLSVLSYPWDVIFVQQVSQFSNNYDSWFSVSPSGYLYPYLYRLRSMQTNAMIGFVEVHSYMDGYKDNTEHSHYARWNGIAHSAQTLMSNHRVFQLLLPCGTAIENLRMSGFNSPYDLTRDGTHLAYGLARYTAAFCIFDKLIRPRITNPSAVYPVFYKCTDEEKRSTRYPCTDVDSTNYKAAQKAALAACIAPYVITE